MQFDRGFVSPYFVTDPERMISEYENCRILLVDKKISSARDIVGLLEGTIRGGYPLLIMAEDFEQEPLATLVVNKLRGNLKVIAVKAPGFGERRTQYLEDIAIMTGATMVKVCTLTRTVCDSVSCPEAPMRLSATVICQLRTTTSYFSE